MDFVSHMGWGYASLRWRGKKEAWLGAAAGGAPDFFFFVPSKIERLIENGWSGIGFPASEPGAWRADGPPLPPEWMYAYETYYVWTHSFVILAAALGIFFVLKKQKWLWLGVPYALHILMDIPTHERFQTQFLYPLSRWSMEGTSWSVWWIFWPNWIALLSLLTWLWWQNREKTYQK